MIKSTKALLLAGTSALAILACAAEANAETFTMSGMFSFTASVSGEYAVELLGASGGDTNLAVGGLGAEVSGDVSLTAGEDLTLFVGGQAGSGALAGGGGGSFVLMGRMSLPSPAGAAALRSASMSTVAVPDWLEPAAEQQEERPGGLAAWVGPAAAAATAAARA
jgi:Glycine rich protein